MKIRDYFIDAIHHVMSAQNIQPTCVRPDPWIRPDSKLEEVLDRTDWYVAGRAYTRPTLRYDHYRNILDVVNISNDDRVVHIDVGCGTGTFAWALLDWAQDKDIDFRNVNLYGYDWSEQAIYAARMIRLELKRKACPGFPELNYEADLETFKRRFSFVKPASNNVYLITFGHVIAGSHNPNSIADYLTIIHWVESVKEPSTKIWILVSDAGSSKYAAAFKEGWASLTASLSSNYTAIPGAGGVRCLVW